MILWQCMDPAQACALTFAYVNQATPPFVTATAPDMPLPGIAVEIVKAAAAANGCKASFVRRPGKRVLAEVSASFHAGAVMFSHSAERAQAMVYPMALGSLDARRRLARMTYYLYRKSGSALGWDGIALEHVGQGAIGANLGYAVVADLKTLGVRIEEVSSTAQNLDKLRMGRLAGYAMHEDAVDALMRQPSYGWLEKLPLPLSTRDYYLAFSRNFYAAHPALAEKIWDEIAAARDATMALRRASYEAQATTDNSPAAAARPSLP